MGKISKGQVIITLPADDDGDDGEELVLKPTLRAANLVSNKFGGYIPAIQALGKLDLGACVAVVQAGTNAKDADARALPEKLWEAGLAEVVAPKCIEFVRILMNGGKDPDEAASSEGKAAA